VPAELANHPRYRVLQLLGAGGMGSVYKAEHRLMERLVALKVINATLINQPGAVERFHREVKAAARLVHSHIVTAYDAEQVGDMHFLVMEFVEGWSLAKVIEKKGRLPVPHACDYIRQAALGLQHAFEQGMVHRDIKPHNLMLTSKGRVKILDFGLARFVSESGKSGGLTSVGAFMGTPDYVAPEQAADAHGADIRADIYSLGCTFYQLLTGEVPFPEGTAIQKMIAHLQQTPTPVSATRHDVPSGLVSIVDRMMAKDASQRFQTPAEVARALAVYAATGATSEKEAVAPAAKAGAAVRPVANAPRAATARPLQTPPLKHEIGPVIDLQTADVEAQVGKHPARASRRKAPSKVGLWTMLLAGAALALVVIGLAGLVLFRAIANRSPALLINSRKAPSMEGVKPLGDDQFQNPQDGYPTGPVPKGDRGFRDGKYFIYMKPNARYYAWNSPAQNLPDVACRVIGRVSGAPSSSWGLLLNNYEQERGIAIMIDGEGKLSAKELEGVRSGSRGGVTIDGYGKTHAGPITPLNVNSGEAFNELFVVARGRVVEIYVNQIAVCDPVVLEQDLTPTVLALGVFAQENEAQAEFERITVWPADGLPTPEPRGGVAKKLSEDSVRPHGNPRKTRS
jgi:serine/threonine protein kinase